MVISRSIVAQSVNGGNSIQRRPPTSGTALPRLGAPAGWLPNDIDVGPIGSAQYDTWKANFGRTFDGGSGSLTPVTIPEPASAALMLLGALGPLARQRRGRYLA
jgi:hypothetical protein